MRILLILIAMVPQDEGQRPIAERHEREGRWKEALESYEKAYKERPRELGCGTCRGLIRREIRLAQARCLSRLERRDDALAIIDTCSLEGDSLLTKWAVRAIVEATYGTPRESSFREKYAKVVPRFYYPADGFDSYLKLYKAERAHDVDAMVEILVVAIPQPPRPFSRDRWEGVLAYTGWVGAEAIACLGRTEKGIQALKKRVIADDKGSRTALRALATLDHPEAKALFENTAWIPEAVGGDLLKKK